eukprot:2848435-Pleurochrysis_carterae.AAC.2
MFCLYAGPYSFWEVPGTGLVIALGFVQKWRRAATALHLAHHTDVSNDVEKSAPDSSLPEAPRALLELTRSCCTRRHAPAQQQQTRANTAADRGEPHREKLPIESRHASDLSGECSSILAAAYRCGIAAFR